jgi:hypothetical protein
VLRVGSAPMANPNPMTALASHLAECLKAMRRLNQPFSLEDCDAFYVNPRTGRVSPTIREVVEKLIAAGALRKLAPGLLEVA